MHCPFCGEPLDFNVTHECPPGFLDVVIADCTCGADDVHDPLHLDDCPAKPTGGEG